MFFFTYLPQLAVLVFVNGPLAVLSTVVLILSESATITNTIARASLFEEALLDTFDGTLIAKGQVAVVKEGREVKDGRDPMQRLGKILKNPFAKYSPKAIVRYFMYLPLNFIPGKSHVCVVLQCGFRCCRGRCANDTPFTVVGTIIFVILQARTRGRSVHERVSGTYKYNILI